MKFYEKLEAIEENIEWIENEDVKNDMIWMSNMLREMKEDLSYVENNNQLQVIRDQKEEIEKLRESNDNLVNVLLGIEV